MVIAYNTNETNGHFIVLKESTLSKKCALYINNSSCFTLKYILIHYVLIFILGSTFYPEFKDNKSNNEIIYIKM